MRRDFHNILDSLLQVITAVVTHRFVTGRSAGSEQNNSWHHVSGGKYFHPLVRALFPGDAFRRVLLKVRRKNRNNNHGFLFETSK